MADSNDVPMGSKNPKCWTVLENDPKALNTLAHSLGLSRTLSFYEVPSLDEPDILGIIPRPVYALCFIVPMTPFWDECRKAEDENLPEYQGSGPQEPVIWFKQTIGHACGSIAMLHCCLNGYAASELEKGSTLERIGLDAEPLKMKERVQVLYDCKELEDAHKQAASIGDTVAPDNQSADKLGQHFVAFVKGKDLHLYELEGSRKGPLDRGVLGPEEDLLSKAAIDFVRASLEKTGEGDLRFSCTALAAQTEGME